MNFTTPLDKAKYILHPVGKTHTQKDRYRVDAQQMNAHTRTENKDHIYHLAFVFSQRNKSPKEENVSLELMEEPSVHSSTCKSNQ